jgi:hypothetical protein
MVSVVASVAQPWSDPRAAAAMNRGANFFMWMNLLSEFGLTYCRCRAELGEERTYR